MPAKHQPIERLNLTFRTESPAVRSLLPGGWWIWCLFGIAIGLSAWLASRYVLTQTFSEQLANAKDRNEAMMAIESLILLDPTASNELVAGLRNEDPHVSRTAFRVIEGQITRWQALSSTECRSRMQLLARALEELPSSTPKESLVLAGSLASRLYAICLDRDDAELKPIMEVAEQVIERVGRHKSVALVAPTPVEPSIVTESNGSSSSAEYTEYFATRQPPPPLPPVTEDANEGRFSDSVSAQLSDHPIAEEVTGKISDADGSADATSSGNASLRLVKAPVRSLIARQATEPSTPIFVADDDAPAAEPQADALAEQSKMNGALAGIESLPIPELVRLLGSVQPRVAQQAALTLRGRGMSEDKLELAMELAAGDELRRLELIDQIARREDLDPRVWLLWMAKDGQPAVRRRSISQLISMLDLEVRQELRQLLNRERDPQIAQVIQQILATR
jgi:hypothetical protein